MTPIITLLRAGPAEATNDLRSALEPVLAAGDLCAAVLGVQNPAAQFARKIVHVLESPLGGFVIGAWATHDEVKGALTRTRSDPDASELVSLDGREVAISDTLRVEINHVEVEALEPTLTIALVVRELDVTVKGGRIIRVGTLEAEAKVQLTLCDRVLLEGTSTRVSVPGMTDVRDLAEAMALDQESVST